MVWYLGVERILLICGRQDGWMIWMLACLLACICISILEGEEYAVLFLFACLLT